jgi:serine/threonine protein kinase
MNAVLCFDISSLNKDPYKQTTFVPPENSLEFKEYPRDKMGKLVENYSLQEVIGSGVYGKVYKATHISTRQQFAVKVIKVEKFKDIPKL